MIKISIKIFKIAISLIAIWFAMHSLYIIIDGIKDHGQKADLAVILGSKVNEDGTLSKRLEKRLESGISLYKKHRVKIVLVSGGLGKEGYYEGDKMKEFLIANGIPKTSILVDNYGNTTRATVDNTLKLKKQLKFDSLIIVSQYFHVTRTKKLFQSKGFNNVSSVSPGYFEWRDIYSIVREFPAYYTQ